ncbi:hypothetical protein [uncultured phage cr50_1]|uniref:Tail fiber protein n=1 Tax=uncultured phage cr50_1 TaxID=2772059 RepID=A0A7M1RUJ7_9CAUD|nr:tail protein [uncultured phage cr50_1]QOR58073.1 hypothetical protein [uncultured phage cr50_1]
MVIKVKYNGEWVKIPYLSSDHGQELVEEAPKDGEQYARQNGVWSVVNIPEVDFTEVYNAIDTKVDKVEGKGLSTNDYVTADKTKVTNINEVIEAATKNITATGISITLDKRNLVTNVVENIELNLPASTTALAGLMLPSDKTKLNGIAAGAEVNVNADWNATEGDALILNKPTLSTVATSGSYNDLTSKPTIPTVDVNKEYVDTQLATKSDLPDYTVFDIVMEIASSDNPSISQENYNKLLEKLPSNAVNIFPVRDNGVYISSLFGGYNVNDDNNIWFRLELNNGVLQNNSAQISIYQDLTVSVDSGMNYLIPVSNGIDVYTNLISGLSENNTKQLTIHTTGDGTKALMDDGTYKSIPSLEDQYAYGVEWDTASSSPDGVRVGNIQLHRELPIQSKMRRCLLDRDGGVKEYLDNEFSWGGSYLDYAVMTEMPEHWYKLYFNGTKFRMMLSEIPLPGYKHVDKFYISTHEARMYRTDNLLCSAAGASKLSDPNSINFRGGDNTAEWDDTYRSLLGCPVTNLTRDQFRQAARKRGSGWEMYTYNAHKILFWLFAVEYATLDSQKPFNAQKDANGFAQGGLGPGPTQMTDWANFNNTNPLIPCGYTNEFGNGSGEKAYVVKNASGGTHATLMANRYRGIENPFGHIWKYTDGANIQVTTGDAGLSILWTTDDPSNFGDTSYTGYDKKGNICRTKGYAKKMLLGEDGDIVATEIGGSSSTYWCDYYTYTSANRMQVVLVGGNAGDGSYAGLAYVHTAHTPSDAYRYIGSRLCFFPKYKSTQITA